jgi:RNA polymerase sigma factor (sigma-70 family)
MNCNSAALAHASVRASSAQAVSGEIPCSKQSTPRRPVRVSGTLHSMDMVKGNLQPASELAQRDRIVLEHLPLVKAIAVRVHENLPVHVDLDDLVHAGVLGLFDAANKYNTDKQVVFSSYAKHRIKGAILDSLRQLDWASREAPPTSPFLPRLFRGLAQQLDEDLLSVNQKKPRKASPEICGWSESELA